MTQHPLSKKGTFKRARAECIHSYQGLCSLCFPFLPLLGMAGLQKEVDCQVKGENWAISDNYFFGKMELDKRNIEMLVSMEK